MKKTNCSVTFMNLVLFVGAVFFYGQTATADSIVSAGGGVAWSSSTAPISGTGRVGVTVDTAGKGGTPVYTGSVNGVPTTPTGPITVAVDPSFLSRGQTILFATKGFIDTHKKNGDNYAVSGSVTGTSKNPSSASASASLIVGSKTVAYSTRATAAGGMLAVARADDPLTYDAGTTEFDPSFTDLPMTDSGGAVAETVITGTSTIPGYENLFTLTYGVLGALSSLSDVYIDFESNPLLGLNDASIDSQILSHLSLSGNDVSLDAPVDFSYTLTSDTSYDVNLTINSIVSGVPEPSSALLFGVGGLILFGARRFQFWKRS